MENYGYKPQFSQSLTFQQSALCSHRSVTLFTTALTYKSVCKTYLVVSDSHDKGKDTVAEFVDFPGNHFDNPGAVHDIIWPDGPSSEFKNILRPSSI